MSLQTPEYIQASGVEYTAEDVRYQMATMSGLGECVIGLPDYRVVQRAAGANMSVDVAAGSGYVRGDTAARQGLYHVVNDATVNVVVSAADSTDPRIDQIVLRVYDDSYDGSGDNMAALEVVAGTPTTGADLENRDGAAALPDTAMRLADVLVDAGATSIVTVDISDRRTTLDGSIIPIGASDYPLDGAYSSIRVSRHPEGFGSGYTRIVGSDGEETISVIAMVRRGIVFDEWVWRYTQDAGTPLTGDYEFAIYDLSGLLIAASGVVAFSGAASATVEEVIAVAGELDAGPVRLTFSVDSGVAGDGAYADCLLCDAVSEGPGTPDALFDLGTGVTGSLPGSLAAATAMVSTGISRGVPKIQINGVIL